LLVQNTSTARREPGVQVVTGGVLPNLRIEILAIGTAIVHQVPNFSSILDTARILERFAGVPLFGKTENDQLNKPRLVNGLKPEISTDPVWFPLSKDDRSCYKVSQYLLS